MGCRSSRGQEYWQGPPDTRWGPPGMQPRGQGGGPPPGGPGVRQRVDKPCTQWANKGSCNFGNDCIFRHDLPPGGMRPPPPPQGPPRGAGGPWVGGPPPPWGW